MSVPSMEQDRLAAMQAQLAQSGHRDILISWINVFTSLATMGLYRATDEVRQRAHAELDEFLDATLDFNRRTRAGNGLP